ncbi:MAG: glycosyltransferase family 39 protein [Chloroflexi bacterium]|nr:glycosyltransferase family 39 protein [Chloroflexota bacterium]
MKASSPRSFFSKYHILVVAILFIAGLGIRVYDLTDLPLDFHPTRQLLSMLKARGMYYQGRGDVPEWQRQFAVQQWKSKAEIEPEIIERLTALTYRFTGEQVWVGRAYSILFWMVGGIFLYLLARDLVSEDGALVALAFYLFLPYVVFASRSFQPDPLMVTFILAFWWAVMKWAKSVEPRSGEAREESKKESSRSWRLRGETFWAILAGLLGGLAILIKFSAAFFVLGGGLGAALSVLPLKELIRRPQVWVMAALGVLPGAAYFIYGVYIAGFLGQQFSGRFIPSLLASPAFYLNWLSTLNHVLGLVFALALLGIFFFRQRGFILGLWGAYFVYGFYFDYHIWSHDYYNLPLLPIAALSLSPLGAWVLSRLTESTTGSRWMRLLSTAVLALGLVSVLWDVRSTLKSTDYRPEAAMWAEIGQTLGQDARVVGLTQDYGSRLDFWGWLDTAQWPLAGDLSYHEDLRGAQADFEERFKNLASKRDFFLVTLPDELKAQPMLKERLATYPIFAEGDGYVIYDLR